MQESYLVELQKRNRVVGNRFLQYSLFVVKNESYLVKLQKSKKVLSFYYVGLRS